MSSAYVSGETPRPQTTGMPPQGVTFVDRPIAGRTGAAVSWAAILAGALGAAALSLILLVLGVGLGLSSVSPWASHGVSAATFGVGTIVWMLAVVLVASGVGGYLAGRLRTAWTDVHTDEIYFRDTAHGFLAWAVATLLTAAFLGSTIGSILGTGAQAAGTALTAAGSAATATAAAGAKAAAGADKSNDRSSVVDYFSDALFRPAAEGAAVPMSASASASEAIGSQVAGSIAPREWTPPEVARIFARSISTGTLTPEDRRYVAQLIAQRTGMTEQAAEKRVADSYANAQQTIQQGEAKAKEAAEQARKAAAHGSLWLFVSLLLGAFISSLMATFGGRQRDTI